MMLPSADIQKNIYVLIKSITQQPANQNLPSGAANAADAIKYGNYLLTGVVADAAIAK